MNGYSYALIREELSQIIARAIARLVSAGKLPPADYGLPEIADTKVPDHGDYACNIALSASKKAGMSPRDIGELLIGELDAVPFLKAELAGPGFINLRLSPVYVAAFVPKILELGQGLARSKSDGPKTINVEYVSVNPNGPITVGSGRGAAFGSCLASVLEAAGHTVHREYYINDGVNSEQMRLFAESVMALTQGRPVPDNGYKGDYVAAVAEEIKEAEAHDVGWYQSRSQDIMLSKQRLDLESFGVRFDTWFSEQSLHDAGVVEQCLDELMTKQMADSEPHRLVLKLSKGGKIDAVEIQQQPVDEDDDSDATAQGTTVWLRSTKFADDMDRVLRRRDGRLTYIASDVAYHKDKLTDASGVRKTGPVDKMITILGPDHHGYIGRLTAVVAALLERPGTTVDGGVMTDVEQQIYRSVEERDACLAALAEARERLEVVIFQIVRFMKDGKPAPMRKRDGNIYALIDLIDELGKAMAPKAEQGEQRRVGRDVARFFYLMRSHETHMDFDIDLATKQSDENPVFYAQYAHARVCSVIEKARDAGFELDSGADLSGLNDPREMALIKKVLDLPFEVRRCAEDYGVHRLTTFAVELARTFHHFYDGCRVVQTEQPDLTRARLALCGAARVGLSAVFDILGISAPERMDRAEQA